MPEALQRISQQLTDKWSGLQKQQKIKIGVLTLVIIGIITVALMLSTRSPWVELIKAEPTDSKVITEKLAEAKIPYKLEGNATVIKVKDKDKSNAVLSLAEAGYPKTSYDFTTLVSSESGLGTTDKERNLRHQLALQNEIAKMIKGYPEVNDAGVTLVMPQETDFLNPNQEAKAAVLITTNSPLSAKQAEGIAHLVTASVKGLTKDKVTIVADGKLIYGANEEEDFEAKANDRFALQKVKEKDIEKKIKEVLTGYDDIKVAAQLKLDFDPKRQESIEYSPINPETGEGAVVEEGTKKEILKNGNGEISPGINANPQEVDQYPQGINSASEYKNDEQTRKIAWNNLKTETAKATGEIIPEQSSVAVTVFKDKVYKQEQLEKTGALQGSDWDTFQLGIKENEINLEVDPQVVEQIQNATGIPNVKVIAKERPVFVPKVEEPIPFGTYIPVAITLLLIGLLAFALIKRTQPEEEFISEQDLSVEEILAAAKIEDDVESIDYNDEGSEVKKQLDKFVDEKPEAVAQLLRNWLSEEWE